jgi:hypothetical protein
MSQYGLLPADTQGVVEPSITYDSDRIWCPWPVRRSPAAARPAHRRRPRPPTRHCHLSGPGPLLLQPTHDPIRLPFGTAGAQASRRGQWTRPLERGCKTQCGRSVRKPKPTGLGWSAARWPTTGAAHPTSSGQWSRARPDGTTAVTVTAAGRSAIAATNAEHLR